MKGGLLGGSKKVGMQKLKALGVKITCFLVKALGRTGSSLLMGEQVKTNFKTQKKVELINQNHIVIKQIALSNYPRL